ncbi:MAG: ferredoxin--NADP reductase [Gallionellaceae bacterium]|nr:ferredoxin--NADP reductase [Gallionellaceae bacterium]
MSLSKILSTKFDNNPTLIMHSLNGAETKFMVERIESIQWRTPSLACFRTTRHADFRFTPGHYARLGLGHDSAVVWRPYSIASAANSGHLEFQIILVPGGAFSELFAKVEAGDTIRVDRRCFGFLTLDQIAPGGSLWLLATGTGLAPFLSIIADAATWVRHTRVILVHSVRHAAELMPDAIDAAISRLPESERQRLSVISIVTRESAPDALGARLGVLIQSGALEEKAGLVIDPSGSRVMLCGNPEMIREVRQLLKDRGLAAGRRGSPGQFSSEGYWSL